MSISQFLQLDIHVRAEIAWQGDFIADRIVDGNNIQLYKLDNFFVEVSYNILDQEIITVNAYSSPKILSYYFERVDISSILA